MHNEESESVIILPKGWGDSRWISFEEACWWVATGSFASPGFGPRPMYEFGNDELDLERSFEDQGRFNLARDLIINSILKDRIELYGIIEGPKEGSELEVRRVPWRITPDEAKHAEFVRDDGMYWIAKKSYKEFVVNFITIASIFDHQVLISDTAPAFQPQRQIHYTGKSTRGRRPIRDWDAIYREIVLLANTPDGLPESQGELEEFVARRAQELFDDEPARSTIRAKVAPIYQLLRNRPQS